MCKGMNLSDPPPWRQSPLEFFLNCGGHSMSCASRQFSPQLPVQTHQQPASSQKINQARSRLTKDLAIERPILTSEAKHPQALLASNTCFDFRETKYIRRLSGLKGPGSTFQQFLAQPTKTLVNQAFPHPKFFRGPAPKPTHSDSRPSSINLEVEMIGIEPTTPGLQSRCSPN